MVDANRLIELAARCRANAGENSELDKEVLYALFHTQGWMAWGNGMRPTREAGHARELLEATFEQDAPEVPAGATPAEICAVVLEAKAAQPSR